MLLYHARLLTAPLVIAGMLTAEELCSKQNSMPKARARGMCSVENFSYMYVCISFSPQDKYLHTNCLAALANMSAHFHSLHLDAAQKIVK